MPEPSSIDQTGVANNDSIFNQVGRDQNNYNLISNLKIPPKDIHLIAYESTNLLKFSTSIITLIVVFFLLRQFYHLVPAALDFPTFPYDAQFVIGISFILSIICIDYCLVYKSQKWRVEYQDGTLKFRNKSYRFYEDIWDIEYIPSKFLFRGKLILYIINSTTKTPYEETITFEYKARAKYVYDSFWNQKRINTYLQEKTEMLN